MTITELHNEAMQWADRAVAARRLGDEANERRYLQMAARKEQEAALRLADDHEQEPTRSVLFRSAAALARDAGDLNRALDLVHMGLAGSPPKGIEDELSRLRDEVLLARFRKAVRRSDVLKKAKTKSYVVRPGDKTRRRRVRKKKNRKQR